MGRPIGWETPVLHYCYECAPEWLTCFDPLEFDPQYPDWYACEQCGKTMTPEKFEDDAGY